MTDKDITITDVEIEELKQKLDKAVEKANKIQTERYMAEKHFEELKKAEEMAKSELNSLTVDAIRYIRFGKYE